MMPSTIFQSIFEQHVALSLEKQYALADYLGSHNWNVDLGEGKVDFGQRRVFQIQLLGSEDYEVGTWLWAWANTHIQNSAHQGIFQAGAALREYGLQNNVAELTTSELELDGSIDGHRLALVASALYPADFYYRGEIANGAVYFLVTDTPLQKRPSADVPRLITIITQIINTFEVNHRRMISSYLTQKGFVGDGEVWQHQDGQKLVTQFDALDRLASINA
jgi:hypothetical protein